MAHDKRLRGAYETFDRAQSYPLPEAIRLGKRAFHDQMRLGLAEAYDQAGAAMCRNILLPETAEGMAAFLEKRPPNWA